MSSSEEAEYKNLGYISDTQTTLANYIRGQVIDWLNEKENHKYINEVLQRFIIGDRVIHKRFIDDFVIKIGNNRNTADYYIVELTIISFKYPDVTIQILNKFDEPIMIFNNGIKYIEDDKKFGNKKELSKYRNSSKDKTIFIKYDIGSINNIKYPEKITVVYHLINNE